MLQVTASLLLFFFFTTQFMALQRRMKGVLCELLVCVEGKRDITGRVIYVRWDGVVDNDGGERQKGRLKEKINCASFELQSVLVTPFEQLERCHKEAPF